MSILLLNDGNRILQLLFANCDSAKVSIKRNQINIGWSPNIKSQQQEHYHAQGEEEEESEPMPCCCSWECSRNYAKSIRREIHSSEDEEALEISSLHEEQRKETISDM